VEYYGGNKNGVQTRSAIDDWEKNMSLLLYVALFETAGQSAAINRELGM
jgi:hypothetical protein